MTTTRTICFTARKADPPDIPGKWVGLIASDIGKAKTEVMVVVVKVVVCVYVMVMEVVVCVYLYMAVVRVCVCVYMAVMEVVCVCVRVPVRVCGDGG